MIHLSKMIQNSGWLLMLGKNRILLAWVFTICLVLTSQQFPDLPGIAICFLGATLRFWSGGYLRKSESPAIGGPYAFTRNPLYLGTYIIALGAIIAVKSWLLLTVMTIVFITAHYAVIQREEKLLKNIFGTPYLIYCKLVPRFVPKLWPVAQAALNQVNPEIQHSQFSWQLARQNKAYEAYAAFAALTGLLALSAYLRHI